MASVLTDISGSVATLTLNRPHHMNSIDLDMAKTLYEVAKELAEQKSVRSIILTGAGIRRFVLVAI